MPPAIGTRAASTGVETGSIGPDGTALPGGSSAEAGAGAGAIESGPGAGAGAMYTCNCITE